MFIREKVTKMIIRKINIITIKEGELYGKY